jgi:hypothetical protein
MKFHKIYRKMYQHLHHRIYIIRSIVKYTFILYVFQIIEVSILYRELK